MSRVSHNMPDTLYMVGSQKRSNTAPALFFQVAAAGRLEQDERSSTAQRSNKSDNELDRYVRNRRTSEANTGMSINIYRGRKPVYSHPLAICKEYITCGRLTSWLFTKRGGVEYTNPSSGREEDLNSGPLDYKSSALTTRPRRLHQTK